MSIGGITLDVQIKKGMLDVCVLAVLKRGDSYGYRIIRDISGCIKISESTLYPILKRLETEGCLSPYSVVHNGRLRKYYHLTSIGEMHIQSFLQEWDEIVQIHDFITQEENMK
jgi:PadR family transcriptional regulator PadR